MPQYTNWHPQWPALPRCRTKTRKPTAKRSFCATASQAERGGVPLREIGRARGCSTATGARWPQSNSALGARNNSKLESRVWRLFRPLVRSEHSPRREQGRARNLTRLGGGTSIGAALRAHPPQRPLSFGRRYEGTAARTGVGEEAKGRSQRNGKAEESRKYRGKFFARRQATLLMIHMAYPQPGVKSERRGEPFLKCSRFRRGCNPMEGLIDTMDKKV